MAEHESGEELLKKGPSVRKQVKQNTAELKQLKPRAAQKEAKANYKEAKADYREAKNVVKQAKENVKVEAKKTFGKVGDQKSSEKLEAAKATKHQAKKDKKVAKKTSKKIKKVHPTKTQRVGRWAKTSVRQATRYGLESALSQDDTLGSVVQARRNVRQAKRTAKAGYRTGKYAAKGTAWTAKTAYKGTRALAKFTTQAVGTVVKSATAAIFSNPISWFVAGIGALLLLVVILVTAIFPTNVVQQTEYTLNQSWVQISQTDAKKSSGDDKYYTDIDSVLLYMNYRYGGEWEPDATWDDGRGGKIAGFMHFNHFYDALDDIWKNMYKDPDNPKTMADLYGKNSDVKWIKLDSDELDDYKDILDNQKEVGKYPNMQELEDPFNPPDDSKDKKKDKDKSDKEKEEDKEKETVTINERYGYYGKELKTDTVLQCDKNTKLYAVMDGTVELTNTDLKGDNPEKQKSKNNVVIKTKNAEFMYFSVKGVRVKDGDKIKTGDEIGQSTDSQVANGQRVAYAKKYETAEKGKKVKVKHSMKDYVFTRKDDKESWMLMNPGFYFQFVKYTQQTKSGSTAGGGKTSLSADQVAQKANISKERAQDAIDILNHMMGEEGATLEGATAVLAIAERESGLDPKAVNPGGGVAGYLQWSGWSSQINGNRWGSAPSRTLDSKTELALLKAELAGAYSPVKTYLRTAKDPGAAALYFSEHYEGVALSDGQTKAEKLQEDAKKWNDVFKGSIKKDGGSGTGSGPGGTKASSFGLPSGYDSKLKWSQPSQNCITGYPGNIYLQGQCTFYVKNRIHETWNIDVDNYLGNGQDWVRSLTSKYGWRATGKPEVGAVMSTAGGFDSTMADYGHVSFVEAVNDDGTFLVSELNYAGNQSQVHYRVVANASYYSFTMPPGH